MYKDNDLNNDQPFISFSDFCSTVARYTFYFLKIISTNSYQSIFDNYVKCKSYFNPASSSPVKDHIASCRKLVQYVLSINRINGKRNQVAWKKNKSILSAIQFVPMATDLEMKFKSCDCLWQQAKELQQQIIGKLSYLQWLRGKCLK